MAIRIEERVLLAGASFWWFGEGLFGPLFAVFTERIGGNILDITWAWATYLLVTGVLVTYMGSLSDRFGKTKLMVAGYFLNALFTWGYLLVSEPTHLFLVQIGLGVAAALATPTWDALYSEYTDRKHDGYLWGISDGLEQIVAGVSILIGGIIVVQFSFPALFIIMGTIQTLGAIYQAKILKFGR